jgi:catechol 2,3-dioxygenase-like lactoylglutathione lyase family enzyme
MPIQRIHHVAYRCRDAKQTVEWYREHLGMDFVLAIAEDQVPSTHAPDPYMHVFLDAGGGNVLAFFELPNSPPMGRDATRRTGCSTSPSRSAASRSSRPPRRGCRRRHRGGRPTDHTIFKSIYFFDPNGHRARTGRRHRHARDEREARRGEVGHARRVGADAPCAAHAAWMHEKEFTGPSPLLTLTEPPMLSTYTYPRYAYRSPAELDGRARCHATRWSSSVPARWAWRRHRPGATGPAGAAARRRRHRQRRLARPVLRQARAGDPGPPGLRRRRGGQGRDLERRPHLLRQRRGLQLQPAARGRPPPPRHGQPAAVLPGGIPGGTRRSCPTWTCAGSTRSRP